MAQARQIFDESFLSIRAKLIEVAAMLDRIDRAAASGGASGGLSPADPNRDESADIAADPRRGRVEEAIQALLRGRLQPGERAATLQQLFSRPYDPQWRDHFDV